VLRTEEALKTVLDSVSPLTHLETVELHSASGRVLGVDIYADTDLPGFDNSAMDGYAVAASDTVPAVPGEPLLLRVVDEIPAGGRPTRELGRAEAVRIMTGAPLPTGADAVVMVEDTETISENGTELVRITGSVAPGENARRAGEDVRSGDLVMSRGRLIRPVDIGLLAALGCAAVRVVRPPEVAVLSTGSELVGIADTPGPGQVRDVNSITLCAGIAACGCLPLNLGYVTDNEAELASKIAEGLRHDMFLVTGGVSVGKYDMVKRALAAAGADVKFWKVAIKPGKPLVFAVHDGRPVFGLPGNPVSALVAFEVFVKPALAKLCGRTGLVEPEVFAVIEDDFQKKPGRRHFVRVLVSVRDGRYYAKVTGPQGSGMLSSMVRANGLAVIPEEAEVVRKGESVRVRLIAGLGDSPHAGTVPSDEPDCRDCDAFRLQTVSPLLWADEPDCGGEGGGQEADRTVLEMQQWSVQV
jgi:molybdopterin molybdotransferase